MTDDSQVKQMLDFLEMDSVDRLFDHIPDSVRIEGLKIPEGLSELETRRKVQGILSKNITTDDVPSFLGSGVYDFYVPAALNAIVSRSEFYSSYTPYQPETSQGILQSMFEYQSMMSELMGMEVVNNSLYDMAGALGEAALMSARISRGNEFLVPAAIHKERRCVLDNYVKGAGLRVIEYGHDVETSHADLADLKSKITENTVGIYFETPNMFGVLEEQLDEIRGIAGERPLTVGVNPLSLAVARPPGDYGADMVIAEGQIFGNPVNFGGPMLGIFACQKKHMRKMPGRVVGLTSDADNNRAFTMTLQTREQHIRREKATSNICTNEALTTLAAGVYMILKGGKGLVDLALEVMNKRKVLAESINTLPGFTSPEFRGACFNEFTVRLPQKANVVFKSLADSGIIGGKPLSDYPGHEKSMVFAVSDKTTEDDTKRLLEALAKMGVDA